MVVAKHHYEVEELMMVAVCEALLQLAAQKALLEGGCGGMHGEPDRVGCKHCSSLAPIFGGVSDGGGETSMLIGGPDGGGWGQLHYVGGVVF